jgi:hypothetical protein
MKFLRRTPREPREQRPRGSLDGPSRTITVEPVETPTPAPPPEVRPEPSREPARPASPTTPPTPAR